MRRCETCTHGIVEGQGDDRRVTCTLIPPTPLMSVRTEDNGPIPYVEWTRPVMKPNGWCGQHRRNWLRLFGYGA